MISIIAGAMLVLLAVALFIFATPEEGKPHRFVTSPTLAAFMPTVVLLTAVAGLILLASALFR